MMHTLSSQLQENLGILRAKKPLVHNITNYVVMNFTANALLALGASPIMAHAREEMVEMVDIVDALVLNLGTLDSNWIESMKLAAQQATNLRKPIILDPVGAGATSLRTAAALELIQENAISIVRGNASEILALARHEGTTRGVDSIHTPEEARQFAMEIARKWNSVIAITGEVDLITDGKAVVEVTGGSALMPAVTGTGCTATAIIAAFAAVNSNFLAAAVNALEIMAYCGARAGEKADGPGSFVPAFLDQLYLC